MTDPLIDQLVADLSLKKPLLNWKLWMHCTACLVITTATILVFMGLRGDYLSAMHSGALFWKPGIFFLAWIGSVLLITDISRPAGSIKRIHLIPLILAGTILVWQLVTQTTHMPIETVKNALQDSSAPYCMSVILGGGSVALLMAWKFWFAKTASPHPKLLGFLAGLSAGALAATAYALHCDKDTAVYVSVYYGLSMLGLGLLGGILGKRLLRW